MHCCVIFLSRKSFSDSQFITKLGSKLHQPALAPRRKLLFIIDADAPDMGQDGQVQKSGT